MKNAKYTVKPTTQFKKDYKLAMRRGLDIHLLEGVIADLAMGIPLLEKNRDHALSGNWAGHRECHVLPDWLLIYRGSGKFTGQPDTLGRIKMYFSLMQEIQIVLMGLPVF